MGERREGGWTPPEQGDEAPNPSGNGGRRAAPPKQASGWLIPAAIVVAGIMIAVAVLISRRGPSETSSGIPVTVGPVPGIGSPAAPPPTSSSTTAAAGGDASAQQNLLAVLDAAEGLRQSTGTYLGATSFDLARLHPGLTFEPPTNPSTGPTDISVSTSTGIFSAAALSDTGTCFYIKRVASGQTTYGTGAACTGAAANAAVMTEWPGASEPTPSPGAPSVSPASP